MRGTLHRADSRIVPLTRRFAPASPRKRGEVTKFAYAPIQPKVIPLYCASANIPPARECQTGVALIGQFRSFTATSAAPP